MNIEYKKILLKCNYHLKLFFFFRPSMSQGTVMLHNRQEEKNFTVATPEEFVKRFNGTRVINKVHF